MSYTLTSSLVLGSGKAGITLAAQLLDSSGSLIGSEITSGFYEVGHGNYLWTYDSFPDGFRGGVKFYNKLDPSVVLTIMAVNPEDSELISKINSTITSPREIEITTGSSSGVSIDIKAGTR